MHRLVWGGRIGGLRSLYPQPQTLAAYTVDTLGGFWQPPANLGQNESSSGCVLFICSKGRNKIQIMNPGTNEAAVEKRKDMLVNLLKLCLEGLLLV
jgi:hypothetical protein